MRQKYLIVSKKIRRVLFLKKYNLLKTGKKMYKILIVRPH